MADTHEKDMQFEKEGEEEDANTKGLDTLTPTLILGDGLKMMLLQNPFTVRWHHLEKIRTSKAAVARKYHQRR
ncbi:hypothetical protein E2562_038294 [Oryza meyeriana var. granulata]|uniref:Uncharacterized protein n=1 Tax=Oryza meyeriana var. granulata TaxID=110450 RepID=A0A6G1C111_9ORYZ|nr:hypothetical protein E2562_038294 [Oryza meyeriana var. granulata]